MAAHDVHALSMAECTDLLDAGGIGRAVFVDEDGPAALPVNFVRSGPSSVIFRVDAGSIHRSLHSPMAFEVDGVDPATGEGWSVLMRGRAHEVELDRVPDLLHELGSRFPRPWAGGVHNHWVVFTAEEVTGRRLQGAYSPPVF